MHFDNPIVKYDELPKYAEVPLQPVEHIYKKVLFIAGGIWYFCTFLFLAVMVFLIEDLQKGGMIAVMLILLSLAMVLLILSIQIGFKNKAWAIREKDILFKKGWLFQKTHIIPFVKVQHCIVSSGPFERRYGLASLRLMTAASHNVDISLRGLKKETADQLNIPLKDAELLVDMCLMQVER